MSKSYLSNKEHYKKYLKTHKGKVASSKGTLKWSAKKMVSLGWTPEDVLKVVTETLEGLK